MQEVESRDFKSGPLLQGELGTQEDHPLCASTQTVGIRLSHEKNQSGHVYWQIGHGVW